MEGFTPRSGRMQPSWTLPPAQFAGAGSRSSAERRLPEDWTGPGCNQACACSGVIGVGFHRARSARSPRTRPGSNGQPPSPTAGWTHLYRVDAPWADSQWILREGHLRRTSTHSVLLAESALERSSCLGSVGGPVGDCPVLSVGPVEPVIDPCPIRFRGERRAVSEASQVGLGLVDCGHHVGKGYFARANRS